MLSLGTARSGRERYCQSAAAKDAKPAAAKSKDQVMGFMMTQKMIESAQVKIEPMSDLLYT
jgi:hypothetical protein